MYLGKNHTPLHVAFSGPLPATVRGKVLCFISVIIACKAVGYIFDVRSESTVRGLSLVTQYVPLAVIGVVLLVGCLFSWFSSYCIHGRDRYGFDVLTGMSAALAAIFLVSALEGPAYGIQGALTWLLIAVLLVFLRQLRDIRDEPQRDVA